MLADKFGGLLLRFKCHRYRIRYKCYNFLILSMYLALRIDEKVEGFFLTPWGGKFHLFTAEKV